MRYRMLVALVCLAGCKGKEEPSVAVAATPPRPPIGLYGDWVHVAPEALRGDTLRLRADSTADGLIPWDGERAARISRWQLIFRSKDPATERADWRLGHRDGGDVECSEIAGWRKLGRPKSNVDSTRVPPRASGCQSMPMLCLGTSEEFRCETFHYVAPDSLWLMDGSRFVRAKSASVSPPADRTS
jgi:hypothetical protein